MRTRWLQLVLVLVLTAGIPQLHAQWAHTTQQSFPPAPPLPQRDAPVTIGLWLELGPQWLTAVSAPEQSSISGAGGLYLELSHHKFRPALEVRGRSNLNVVAGTLSGPRIGWRAGSAIFYASALFGPNYHLDHPHPTGNMA